MAALTPQNLFKRNGTYYLRKQIKGKRYFRSLATPSKEVALVRAKKMWRAVTEELFDVLEQTKFRAGYTKLGDVLDAYIAAVPNYRRPSARTARGNVGTLRKILRVVGITDPDNASTAVLTGELVRKYADATIPHGADISEMERERKMRTVSSDLRQARSVFARRFRSMYRRQFNLPDLAEFLEERPCDDPPAIRQEYSEQEIRIIRAGTDLPDVNPGLYAAWLLGYCLALRAGEMARARWSWIDRNNGCWEMRICRRPDEGFDPKGYDGWVPIADDVYSRLIALRRDGDPYILPGGNYTNRHNLITRELADWMRGQGWTRPHCAHELRAYCGNVWRQTYGLDVARDWLRHKSTRTTQDHYTVNHNTSQPPLGLD